MTRTNFVLFVMTALVLCVLLGLKASLRHAARVPAVLAPAAIEPRAVKVVKPDSSQIPAPAVSVPLRVPTEPRVIQVMPIKPDAAPAPPANPKPGSTVRIAPALAAPRGGGKGSPDGQ